MHPPAISIKLKRLKFKIQITLAIEPMHMATISTEETICLMRLPPSRAPQIAPTKWGGSSDLKYPARFALVGAIMLIFGGLPAAAKDPGTEAYMSRVLACEGPDAKMEVYLPQSVVSRTLNHSVIGYYALDLTEANKGKSLEPVRIRLSPDKQTVIVEQYTRGAPPTRIPVAGGTVDFDNRFGTAANCGPFQVTE